MNKIVSKIKNEFNNNPDLNIKVINKIYIVFLESITDGNRINEYILKNLTNKKNFINLNDNIAGPKTIKIDNYDKIEYFLTNGFTIVIHNNIVLAIETKGELSRSIPTSTREPALIGPDDAFVENYQTNLGLIKRRIKSHTLATKEIDMGRITKTKIGIIYIDNIADIKHVDNILNTLNKIDVDGVLDAGTIINYIEKENKSIFPTLKRTERPDVVANNLLAGKIAIIVDTSPSAIIAPTFLTDFINPITDNYTKSINVGFIKILRLICFIISIIAPALFIAIINYNQETIPTSLLINFSTQRSGVPFPAIVEILIMLLICDLLRESDLRFPSNFGSTISILGALIIGEAAVSAGIVSPIMIIVTSLTFISSLIFTDLEFNNAIRYYRYFFLFFASIFGLYGIFLSFTLFLINVISTKSIGIPYFSPIAPFNKTYFFQTVLKKQDLNNTTRSNLITTKNKIRGVFK